MIAHLTTGLKIDWLILDWIQAHLSSPFADAIIPIITYFGEWGVVWLAIGIGLLFSPQLRPYGIGIIAAVVAAGIIVNLGIKPFVGRARPFIDNPMVNLLVYPPSASSFPSGHSAASFAAATVIAFMPIGKRWKAAAFAFAILIAFTRLYLYVHFPSDVVFGMVLGIACGVATGFVIRKYIDGKPSKPPSPPISPALP